MSANLQNLFSCHIFFSRRIIRNHHTHINLQPIPNLSILVMQNQIISTLYYQNLLMY